MHRSLMISILLVFMLPFVFAIDSSYSLIVEDNGNALVVLELSGSGLMTIPLMEDVDTVKVKGALYMLKQNSVDVSMGSSKKAVVAYKTTYLTKKEGDIWQLDFDAPNNRTTLLLPKNALITKTVPESFIEPGNYTKVVFDDAKEIFVEYKFEDIDPDEPKKHDLSGIIILAAGVISGAAVAFFLYKKPKKSKKEDFLKTLSANEKVIVKILMENNGSLKRNDLEKVSKMAKSSLANTLNNLEKKKILTIDKTYTTHFIKLEGWFDEL